MYFGLVLSLATYQQGSVFKALLILINKPSYSGFGNDAQITDRDVFILLADCVAAIGF